MITPEDWQKLTPSGRGAVDLLVGLLARGFRGNLVLECRDGGVTTLSTTVRHQGDYLSRYGAHSEPSLTEPSDQG